MSAGAAKIFFFPWESTPHAKNKLFNGMMAPGFGITAFLTSVPFLKGQKQMTLLKPLEGLCIWLHIEFAPPIPRWKLEKQLLFPKVLGMGVRFIYNTETVLVEAKLELEWMGHSSRACIAFLVWGSNWRRRTEWAEFQCTIVQRKQCWTGGGGEHL